MIIWISGPTGAGKTTLARLLHASGYSIVEENVPEKLFKAFISDPNAYCASLQHEIMQARFDGWQRVSSASRVAFDRSIDEDIEVFCQMHWQHGRLSRDQLEALADFGRSLQKQMPEPDLILFITSDQEVLLRRIEDLTRPRLILDSLRDQISLYAEWIQNRRGEIAEIDTSRLSEETLTQFLKEIGPC